ncbi:unnamed protein product [Amaranthus hypochondriacus]
MGYLLKEALKALCGASQWSYAVFWKIGCQNPKLLIWEECYYGLSSNVSQISSLGNDGLQVSEKVRMLMDRMMTSNHVNVVGEGLVGRSAFTGNHQWIVSGIYNENAHPAEVLNEVRLQFSAGMNTIVVIPVIPHGVVQLGSALTMMDNAGFVHDVRSFILQLGCIPGAFGSENYFATDAASMLRLQVADARVSPINQHANPTSINCGDIAVGSFNRQRNSSMSHRLVSQSSNCLLSQFQDNLQVSASTVMIPNLTRDLCEAKQIEDATMICPDVNSNVHTNGLIVNKPIHGVVFPLASDSVTKQPNSNNINNPGSGITCSRSSTTWHPSLLKQLILSNEGLVEGKYSTLTSGFCTNEALHAASIHNTLLSAKSELDVGIKGEHGHFTKKSDCANIVIEDTDSSIKDIVGLSKTEKSTSTSTSTRVLNHGMYTADTGVPINYIHGKEQDNINLGSQVPPSKNFVPEDSFLQSSSGDDLFDVLGTYLKNKLLNGNTGKLPSSLCASSKYQITDLQKSGNQKILGSEACSDYEGIAKSGVFSCGSDHLLDAVISGVCSGTRQISDDTSCKTTASKISIDSVPVAPHINSQSSGLFNTSDGMQSPLFGLSKPVVRLAERIGTSIRSACGKNDDGSSAYGSQINSWIEQGPSTSVSTANSKKSDGGKSNRKRLKPGENPRPRPKDRQMIQDRVKELREIVPNGAKCSIDALLERTIKHMLFLQSVTKHADKLKQTGESKFANKDGGLLLKDEFQGSATWAFELGSQSLVCPIVVEDLTPPRQLLIEMLCEERGFFLEIADIVRGLGLTILKGVMEARNDKIWARFAVEANRDVTRMEIFISLVHLLEQTLKSSPTSIDGSSGEDVAVLSSMPANQQLVAPIVCGEPSIL